jgi:hypothetical protein
MRTVAFALTATALAATACLLFTASDASATPANGPAIIHAAKQTDEVITVRRRRCYPGYVRDSHGYCVPSGQGF